MFLPVSGVSIRFSLVVSNLFEWRVSESDCKSMMIVLVGTLINIILDPILIFTFDMGISGAAWATIIAQLVTVIIVIHHFLSEKNQMKIEISQLKLCIVTTMSILSIGFTPFVMQLSSVVVSILSNNALKSYCGDIAIISLKSAFNHLNKLEHKFSSEEFETMASITE